MEGIRTSYPGFPLRMGAIGPNVTIIQSALNRISQNYPAIPKIQPVDGIFNSSTEAAVRKFQSIFNLTPDGIVGEATWYKIIYLYGGITRLSELRSQGQRFYSVEFSQQLPETLQQGDTGRSVEVLQYWLALAGQFNDAIPNLVIDGVFGPTTYQAVRAFQAWTGLPVTGVVDQSTWDYLYRSFRSIADLVLNNELLFPPIQRVTGNSANDYSASTRGQQFPGRSLELGSSDMEGGT